MHKVYRLTKSLGVSFHMSLVIYTIITNVTCFSSRKLTVFVPELLYNQGGVSSCKIMVERVASRPMVNALRK